LGPFGVVEVLASIHEIFDFSAASEPQRFFDLVDAAADLPAWWIVYSMAWGISDRTLGCKLVAVMFLFIVEMKLVVTCHSYADHRT